MSDMKITNANGAVLEAKNDKGFHGTRHVRKNMRSTFIRSDTFELNQGKSIKDLSHAVATAFDGRDQILVEMDDKSIRKFSADEFTNIASFKVGEVVYIDGKKGIINTVVDSDEDSLSYWVQDKGGHVVEFVATVRGWVDVLTFGWLRNPAAFLLNLGVKVLAGDVADYAAEVRASDQKPAETYENIARTKATNLPRRPLTAGLKVPK